MANLSVELTEKFDGGLRTGRVIEVVVAGFFAAAADLTSLGGMASLSLSLTLLLSLSPLLLFLLSPLAVPSSPFSGD